MNPTVPRRRRSIHDRDSATPIADTLSSNESSEVEEDGQDDFGGSRTEEPRTPPRSNRKNKSGQSRPPIIPESANTSATSHDVNQRKGSGVAYVTAVLIVIIGIAVYFNIEASPITKICSYDKLRREHPQQDESVWRTLQVGIENILNERSDMPGVYLFVHQGGKKVNQLVKAIAVQSSSCFGLEMSPLEMDSNDFTSEHAKDDYGYAIQKYKMKIKQGHVILIANLNEIPVEASRALHTICDTYSPIARDVMIFLTLVTKTYGNTLQRAQDTLAELWGSTLKSNELDPLITRVTDMVIPLKS